VWEMELYVFMKHKRSLVIIVTLTKNKGRFQSVIRRILAAQPFTIDEKYVSLNVELCRRHGFHGTERA